MSKIVETLGNNIRSLRKSYGWTQELLAEKSDISVPFMTQIELGRKSASLEVVEKIAQALNVSYERLFKTDFSENKDLNSTLSIFENELIDVLTTKIHEKFDSLSL
ncbi:MAG: helix-turn-helix transcriptional regulator [Treponema sp.]|nr:helix-turn-helix transcriptional regulator [Candidatus Treponema equifaecale]